MVESLVTIGFSPHRVEALPFVLEQMKAHQVIVLEEPPSENLAPMLEGQLSVSDYLRRVDSAFPEFGRKMYEMLREIHHSGQRIFQVEPFLERLLQIHDLLSDGEGPKKVMSLPELREVYLAERQASGALISFYTSSVTDPFDKVVESVKTFALADARRLKLRARLRAKAIAQLVKPGQRMYVEAGYIHYFLYHCLRSEVGDAGRVTVVFPLAPVISKLKGKRRNLGPGDVLTLHYALHDGLQHHLANILAARSLIYAKLIQKEELLPGTTESPHSEDEAEVNRLVDQLQYLDCREIFRQIRLAKRSHALQVVNRYLKERSRHDHGRRLRK